MAALYLHNAIFSPDGSGAGSSSIPPSADIYTPTPQHGRHRSSVSAVGPSSIGNYRASYMLDFSHPTEPLLHPDNSASNTYQDMLSRQPMHPSGPNPGWDMGLALGGDEPTTDERKYFWERVIKKRLKRLGFTKGALEILLGSWATYNTIRYFIAFASFRTLEPQMVSLALGASTIMSLALLMTSALIASFSSHLISESISNRLLHQIRVLLRYLATFLILAPAVVSFALVFFWRNNSNADARFRGRCHWDIDVVWTGPGKRCEPHAPAWGVWLAASIARMMITFIIITIYHMTSRAYAVTRRPSHYRPSGHGHRQRGSYEPSYYISEPLSISPTTMKSKDKDAASSSPVSLRLQSPSSSSTLVDHHNKLRKKDGGDRRSLVSSRSRNGSFLNPSSSGHDSQRSSEADLKTLNETLTRSNSESQSGAPPSPVIPPDANIQASDADIFGFVDRFRNLVSQVGRELDDGLDLARRDQGSNDYRHQHPPPPSAYSYPDPYPDLAAGNPPDPSLPLNAESLDRLGSYDEFGHTMPNDHVLVLGGYIRRMPTIESLGSREVGSIPSSVGHRVSDGQSQYNSMRSGSGKSKSGSGHTHYTGSVPPTRTNTLSLSAPPSRNSSLNVSGGHEHDSPIPPRLLDSPDVMVDSPVPFDPPVLHYNQQWRS